MQKIQVALVGAGEQGMRLLPECLAMVRENQMDLRAVCDVWTTHLEACAAQIKAQCGLEPRKTRSFADLLDDKELNALILATCDFQHAPMLLQAIAAGKDVYVETPIANSLDELKAVLEATRNTNRIIQVGSAARADGLLAGVARLVREENLLGKVGKVEIFLSFPAPLWKRPTQDVRESEVDWNQFLMGKVGPAFDANRFRNWQCFRAYSTGLPGQFMAPCLDQVECALGLCLIPKNAVANGGVVVWNDGRENADTFGALIEYPPMGDFSPEGFLLSFNARLGQKFECRSTIYGTNGRYQIGEKVIRGGGAQPWDWELLAKFGIPKPDSSKTPDAKARERLKKQEEAIREKGIPVKPVEKDSLLRNWLACIRDRKLPLAPPQAALGHTVAMLLADQAFQKGMMTIYDAVKNSIEPRKEADQHGP